MFIFRKEEEKTPRKYHNPPRNPR